MSTLYRMAFIAAMAGFAVGCTRNAPPPSNPTTEDGPSDPAKVPAKEDLTPPDVKLVKVDFKLHGVDLTIEAPEGGKWADPVRTDAAQILFGKDSCLNIVRERKVAEQTAWWKEGRGWVRPKRFLIERPDTLLVEANWDFDGERRFACLTEQDVGGVKYTVALARPKSSRTADLSTKAECLLALKCAKTLALKSPAPKRPEK